MGIKEFIQKFAEDKEFAAKYHALSSLDDALEEAKKDGYSITKEEAFAALQKVKSGELSDEELASVAGGKSESKCYMCGGTDLRWGFSQWGQLYTCKLCGHSGAAGGLFM